MNPQVHEAGPAGGQVLSVFDFDGTLTRRDSFVPFLLFAYGRRVRGANDSNASVGPSLSDEGAES